MKKEKKKKTAYDYDVQNLGGDGCFRNFKYWIILISFVIYTQIKYVEKLLYKGKILSFIEETE